MTGYTAKVGQAVSLLGPAQPARAMGDKRDGATWLLTRNRPEQQACGVDLLDKVSLASKSNNEVDACEDIVSAVSPTALAVAKRSFNAEAQNVRRISLLWLDVVKLFCEPPESTEGARACTEPQAPNFHVFVQ